jgi:hypothetical protein
LETLAAHPGKSKVNEFAKKQIKKYDSLRNSHQTGHILRGDSKSYHFAVRPFFSDCCGQTHGRRTGV